MSKKSQLKKAIDDSEKEIEALEQKRERSQIAVMRAMVSGTQPSPEDMQYFTVFTQLIDNERENLRKLYAELNGMSKKKKKDDGESPKEKKKDKKKKKDE